MRYFAGGGWWLPDHEAHLQGWMSQMRQVAPGGRLGYQLHKYQEAMKWVGPTRRRAVDVGAHVGLWSWPMAHDFEAVEAFEPMPAHADCWRKNMDREPGGAALHAVALGDREGRALLRTRTADSSGDTGVEPDRAEGGVEVPLRRLDAFGFGEVDLLKVDCEGYELFVLRGAEETLRRCRPCVVVEQKPETGGAARYGIGVTAAVAFLEYLGARRRACLQGDYIMSWEER